MIVQLSTLYPFVYEFLVDCKFKKLAKDFKLLTNTICLNVNHPTLLELYETWLKIKSKSALKGKDSKPVVRKVVASKKRKSRRESGEELSNYNEKVTNPPTKQLKQAADLSLSDGALSRKDEKNNLESAKCYSVNLEEQFEDNINDYGSNIKNCLEEDVGSKSTTNRDISGIDESHSISNRIKQMQSMVVKVEEIEDESWQESKDELNVPDQNINLEQTKSSNFISYKDEDVGLCNEIDFNYNECSNHSKACICHICNNSFADLSTLKAHLKVHKGATQFTCNICNKSFSFSCNLKTHLEIHSIVRERPYKCDICFKSFARSFTLKQHLKVHTGERPYSCDICNKLFTRLFTLKEHSKVHTGERPYSCNICNKSYTHSNTLKEHLRVHSGEKPYSCNICNKLFTRSSTLKIHVKIHTGERPYICDICNKSFTQASSLKIHSKVHTGERPYGCDICRKSFTQFSHLKSHSRTHRVKQLYSCDICNKSFVRLYNFKNHIRIHSAQS